MQEVKIRSVLTCETAQRRLRQVLRARSRPRHAGQHGRGGRRHRRAVDRRAGHPAHHAHVPHRRRGADRRAVVHRVRTSTARSRSRTSNDRQELATADLIAMGATWRSRSSMPTAPSARMHRIPYGARLRVDDGDKVKRGQRIAEWDPYTRPILTEVEGTVGFEDLVEGLSMSETLDEVDRHRQARGHRLAHVDPRGADLRPAIVIKGKDGKILKLARGGEARYLLAVDAIISVDPGAQGEGRRRARAYPDRKRQDPRHHRRSAAGGGTVRGAPAEGRTRSSPRSPARVRFGTRLQEQAPHHHRADRQGRGAGRVPDPEGQAHPSAGRRHHREGRLHRRRQSGAARHPGDQGRRGARRLSRQRNPGGLPAAGRARSTTSTSR